MNGYEDILYMEYHRATKRARMTRADRAAQFSPFAALTGYEQAIQETGRLTQSFAGPSWDGLQLLDETLRNIYQNLKTQPMVTVTYFIPDQKKSGGSYNSLSGKVKQMDPHKQILLLEDGTEIAFSRIYRICMEETAGNQDAAGDWGEKNDL